MPRIQAETLKLHTQRQREKILSAAFEILECDGYPAATMDRIATESGMARNSLYKYFSDRQRLLFESVLRRVETLLAAAAADICRHTAPIDRILAWVDAVAAYCGGTEQRFLKLLAQIEIPQAEVRRRLRLQHLRMFDQLRADFIEAHAGTGLDPELWAIVFDGTARVAGQYGFEHGNLDQARKECRMVCRGHFLTRYTSAGAVVLHA